MPDSLSPPPAPASADEIERVFAAQQAHAPAVRAASVDRRRDKLRRLCDGLRAHRTDRRLPEGTGGGGPDRDEAPTGRGPVRDQPPRRLDGPGPAQPPGLLCGHPLGDPLRAEGGRADSRPLELPPHAHARPADRRPRGGQLRDAEAFREDAPHERRPQKADRRLVRGAGGRPADRREGGGAGPPGAAVRPRVFHRQPAGRPARDEGRGGPPGVRNAGTRGQVAGDRRRDRRPRPRGGAHRLVEVHKRGADLHRPGLRARRRPGARRPGRPSHRHHRTLLRHDGGDATGQRRLRPPHRRRPLGPCRGAPGGGRRGRGHRGRRRADQRRDPVRESHDPDGRAPGHRRHAGRNLRPPAAHHSDLVAEPGGGHRQRSAQSAVDVPLYRTRRDGRHTTAGSTCINEGFFHYANPDLPFGGAGHSGIGRGHGEAGFRAFSNERSVLRRRYGASLVQAVLPPFTDRKESFLATLLRYLSGP